jgi:hypothetical protein
MKPKILLIAHILMLATCSCAASEEKAKSWPEGVVTIKQQKDAATQYSAFDQRPEGQKKKFLDGAQGYEIYVSPPRYPAYSESDRQKRNAAMVRQLTCYVNLVAVVSGQSAKSFETEGGMIYTHYKLNIDDLLFTSESSLSKSISFVQMGGTLKKGNEVMRVAHNLYAPLKHKARYLLVAMKSTTESDESFYPAEQTIEVQDGRIYPISGRWLAFDPGTPISEIATHFRNAGNTARHHCK